MADETAVVDQPQGHYRRTGLEPTVAKELTRQESTMHVELPCVPPCYDEFDDGVPPPCRGEARWWKFFNPAHPVTNQNPFCHILGNVGFDYFSRERKKFMGAAMYSTLLSMGFTAFGCFALSTNPSIVKTTHWTFVSVRNTTSQVLSCLVY